MNIGGLRERLKMAQRRAALAEEACHEPWPRRRGPRTGAIRCDFTPKQTNSDDLEPQARRLNSGEKPSQRCAFPPRVSPDRGLPIPPPTGLR